MPRGTTDTIQQNIEDMRSKLKKLREPLSPRITKIKTRLAEGKTVFLSPSTASEIGLPAKFPSDWTLKITPGHNGDEPAFSYHSPEGTEFAEQDIRTTPEGEFLSASEMEEIRSGRFQAYNPVTDTFQPTTRAFVEAREEAGLTPEELRELAGGRFQPTPTPSAETELSELFQRVYPDFDFGDETGRVVLSTMMQWADEDPNAFLQDILAKGRNPDTEALLRAFEAPDELIDEIFTPVVPEEISIPKTGVFPIDGIRQLVTIDQNTGMAYDRTGNNVGSLDPIKREITTTPPEGKAKDIWDAAVLSAASMWHRTKQYFVSSLPNLLFRDMTDFEREIQGDEWADITDARNEALRDKFRQAYARNNAEFEEWVEKRPELQPKREYQEGVMEHPELLKDPYYYAYEIASAAPFMAGVMATAIVTTAVTGNPLVGLTAGMLVATPSQTQDVYEALLENGATEEQATVIANPIGAVISAVEVLGDIPFFKAVAPQLFKFFRKEATEEIAKQTMKGLLKRGITTATQVEIAETLEEVVQGALQNAAVKIVNEHQDIFEGLADTAIRAAIASAPFALFGGGASIRTDVMEKFEESMPEVVEGIKKLAKGERGALGFLEEKPGVKGILSLDEISQLETRISLDLIRKDEAAEIERLTEKIREEGLKEPITIMVREDGSRVVWDGMHRLIAAQTLGIKNIPVKYIGEGVTPPVTPEVTTIPKEGKIIPEKGKPEAPPTEVKPAPEIEAAKTQAPQVTKEIETVISDLQAQVEKTSEEVKGKRGEAARISREALKGLEREVAYAQKTLETFREQVNVPDAVKLRQTIVAMARFKGIGKTQLRDAIKSVAGQRHLRNVASPQLLEILEKVREARPLKIGYEKVVTLKTEAKIQSLKESLISSRQMTEEIYNHIKERLNLRTDRYEHAQKFITESDAKELIRAMNDEVVLARWDIKVKDALAKNPAIKGVRDGLNDRGMAGTGVEFNGEPIKVSRGTELYSMRYYVLNLQKKLAAPIYDTWQKINQAHLVARDRHNQQLRRLQDTTPNFKEVASDEKALKRIEDYIASKHNLAKIKAPELSDDEMAIATELERGYFEAQNDVRFIRFVNAYAENEGDIDLINKEIPSAPKKALRRAIDVYEGKGADELRKFTDTQKWGVIEKGYDPRSFIKPILYFHAPRETTFAKGLLRTRSGVEYQADETNIIQRYSRHQKQLIALQEMSSLIRAFGRLYAEHAHKLAPSAQRDVSKVLSRGLNEMKGYREDAGAIIHAIERLYGQVAAVVFWRPDLVARNKFQNFAFNPDYWAGRFADPRNKPISEARRRWFEVFVSQERVFQFEYLLYGEKPLPGFGLLTRLARRTSLYPWSDKTNRAEAFMVRINRVDRALDAYDKHGDVQRLIDDSGLNEFEPRQQAEALEYLSMDSVDYGIDGMEAVSGREAFALYITQQLVNNVHFLYDRAQRAPAEMGATGKTLGNILVFNRSWGERFILQGRKLDPKTKATIKERLKAVQVIVGVVVAGLLAGEVYKKITGKEHNPYNPLNIITWTPGGLALGVTEDISNTIYLITQAVQGDKSAFGSLPGVIAGVATLTLPFYKNAVQALDAVTDMKNVDVYALRKIREMIDDEYEVRGGTHEVERTLLEKLQRAIFSFKDQPVTPQEKIDEAETQLGWTIDVGDVPFTLEEPDIYNMRKLNSDMSRILGNVKPEDITRENKYSDLAMAWKEKEGYEAIWNTLPNKKLYEITELPEELEKWASRHKRELSLITKYQKLEGAEAKEFLEEHPELKVNPAIEWLKQFPIANARLALWGQAKIYSKEAYDEFNRLVKELDVPDDAIPELTLPPKGSVENYFKYQETGGELGYNSWEVQLLMAQDDDLRQFLERQPIETPVRSLELKIKGRELEEDSQEFRDNERRIEAIENGAPDEIESKWVERGHIVDEFTAGSSEAMVWLLDHKNAFDWAIDNGLLTDDGSDWNEERLRLNVEKNKLEEGTSEFAEVDTKLKAFERGLPSEQIDNFAIYNSFPEAGYRRERFLMEHPVFAEAMGLQVPEKVPSEKYDILLEKEDRTPEDELRMDAYKIYVPDKYIEDYVTYHTSKKPDNWEEKNGTDLYYADDWWMMEHQGFYKEVYLGILGNQRKDYRTVPTREVFNKYLRYLELEGKRRSQFRLDNLDLDKWLVLKFGYTPIEEQEIKPEKKEPEKPEGTIEESLEDMREKLSSLMR